MADEAKPKSDAYEKSGDPEHVSKLDLEEPQLLAEALSGGAGVPNPWHRQHLKLYAMCIVVYLCSTMNGYDGSLMGSINIVPEYQEYYGLGPNGTATTGIVFSIYQIGQMVASLFIWIADWRGRRFTVILGCTGVTLASVFTALAPNISAFIGARFLLSFFGTLASTSAPLLLCEIAPPMYRGTVAGTYNTLYYMGSIIATFAIYGSNLHIEGNLKWRLVLWLQMICPGLVVAFSYFIPESPRFLVGKGRTDQARDFIVKYHANADPDHPIVDLEMNEITQSLQTVSLRTPKNFYDIRPLFNTRARRYRLMLCVAMSWFGQFSGNNVASYFLPQMVKTVGITSTRMGLLLNAFYAVSGWVAASIGARLHDVAGRRKMLMGSCAGMAVCLAVVAGTTADYEKTHSKAGSSASIAFIFIFGVVFAIAFTSMQPIYPAEVMSNDMRANGMMIHQLVGGCAGFVNTFAAPLALRDISYWFYVFFVFWDIGELLFIYFFFVETKGRTLEELDVVFEAKNPRKASTKRRQVRDAVA